MNRLQVFYCGKHDQQISQIILRDLRVRNQNIATKKTQ